MGIALIICKITDIQLANDFNPSEMVLNKKGSIYYLVSYQG
jgi:hypothetical protein